MAWFGRPQDYTKLAIVIDEFNAALFESCLNFFETGDAAAHLTAGGFEVVQRAYGDASFAREVLLRYPQQLSSSGNL